MSNKVIIEAPLTIKRLLKSQVKELAKKLDLPENNQSDLLFMSAILVSTGTNKNGATFLGSELIKARNTISQKALDIEHIEDEIIGHIASSMYMDFKGNPIDDSALYKELAASDEPEKLVSELDNTDMDIGIVCVVYKDRFPDLAEEIEKGEWKVSMECYFDDFDIKIGNLIIPKDIARKHCDIDKVSNEHVKLTLAGKQVADSKVSRVLRGIRFCGVGIVKNPANERSLILEAASENATNTLEQEGFIQYQEAASINLDNLDGVFVLKSQSAPSKEVVQVGSAGFLVVKVTDDSMEILKDSLNLSYNEAAKEAIKRSVIDGTSRYMVVDAKSIFIPRDKIVLNEASEAVTYHTNDLGEVKEIHSYGVASKEAAHLGLRYGPEDSTSGLCISFEKYVKEFPGSPNPGRIVRTHWCKLFNKPCPVLGADAQDPDCLRNKFSRLLKEGTDGGALYEAPYNPRTGEKDLELLESQDLPRPKTSEESLEGKRDELTPAPESLLATQPSKPFKAIPEPKAIKVGMGDSVPKNPLPAKKQFILEDPITDFPVQLASISFEERKSLNSSEFGLPVKRKFPLHTEEAILNTMSLFESVLPKLSAKERKELFLNTIKAAANFGLGTKGFETVVRKHGLKYEFSKDEDSNEEYGIPRLKLFPLNTKAQVLSAMSRFPFIKADISEQERDYLVVNILRAATSLGVDASAFKERVRKPQA